MNEQSTTPIRPPIPGVKHVLVVASGKGGVGKSTTAANLSVAMTQEGARVGLMDADIYGPNVPLMMGAKDKPEMSEDGQMQPLERHGVKFISLGLLAGDGVPVIWRGPMLAKMVTQFLHDVAWAPLDCLVVDLPPGTGDVQLTLTQTAPIDGAIIVTTPQPVALEDVRRGVQMFKTVDVPIMGLIENMSSFVCSKCETKTPIFGEGGGRQTAEFYEIPYFGEVPIDSRLQQGGENGIPVAAAEPSSEVARIYRSFAQKALNRLGEETLLVN